MGEARALAGFGCLLLGLYVLPVYLPPGPTPVPQIGPETGLWTRLFPHVPVWMALRLSALGVGALLLAWAGRGASLTAAPALAHPTESPNLVPRTSWWERSAVCVAALLVAAAAVAARLPDWAQYLLIPALGLPAFLLWVADALDGRGAPRARAADRPWWGAVVLLVAIWVVWRIILARHDPRAADLVDMWKNFGYFLDASSNPTGILAQTHEVGVSSLYLLSIGLPFVSGGFAEPSFAWIQMFHAVWITLTALGLAALVRRLAGPPAMLPAVAALLFSPFMLSMALCVAPFAFMTALAVALALLVCRIHESPRGVDVAAFGAVAGVSVSLPHLALWTTAASLALLPWLLRRRPPLLVWLAAALTGLAALIPVLPNLLDLSGMAEAYVQRRGVALELEQLIMGQKYYSHREVGALWQSGIRGLFEVPIAALLQPFAILRSPVRLSGDVHFEPIAAALAAVGIATCIPRLRRDARARVLCGVMALGMLPAFAAATDRASLTRNLILPLALPLFTVVGLNVVVGALRCNLPLARLAPALAAVIAVSGIAIFDGVNPRILPTTWLSISLRGLEGTPAEEVVLLEHGNPRNDWLHVAEIARYLPPSPIPAKEYRDGGSLLLDAGDDAPAASVILWSPGLEEQASVGRTLCGCWPESTLHTLWDEAGLSRALAARLPGVVWEPSLPRERWSAAPCPESAPPTRTCATLGAMAHNDRGQRHAERGKIEEAMAAYRESMRLDPNYAPARVSLGLALASIDRFEEATAAYRDALRLDANLSAAHNNLAIALENLDRHDEAITHYLEAVRIAPEDARSRVNLGALLAGRGRLDEAVAQLREALVLAPYLPEAHVLLADALTRSGRAEEAIAAYRAAVRDRPGWPPATNGLAWILATADDPRLRDPQEARRLADETVRITAGSDANALRTLAVANAAAGRLDEAAEVAERALAVAEAAGQQDLARDLKDRIAAYRGS